MCRVQDRISSHLLTGPCRYLSVYPAIKKLSLGDTKIWRVRVNTHEYLNLDGNISQN